MPRGPTPPKWSRPSWVTAVDDSVLVGTEVEVVQRDGLAATLTEVVVVVVAGDLVGGRTGLLGRLDADAAVALQTGTGRDQLSDDHVFLQTQERVRTTVDRRVGEHPGRLLEGG